MKLAASLLVLLTATPALAAECYSLDGDASWTITVNDPGTEPEMVWKQGDKLLNISTSGVGVDNPGRVAWVEDDKSEEPEGVRFFFHKGDLIFDNSLYVAGCP